jgi:hypothetical protein
MPALNEENLYRPFIAEDGLEYDDFAAFLCGQPQDTWRNRRIQEHRKNGRSESALRQWIKGYDGDDPRTTSELGELEVTHRSWSAAKAKDAFAERMLRRCNADSAAYVVEPHDDFLPF